MSTIRFQEDGEAMRIETRRLNDLREVAADLDDAEQLGLHLQRQVEVARGLVASEATDLHALILARELKNLARCRRLQLRAEESLLLLTEAHEHFSSRGKARAAFLVELEMAGVESDLERWEICASRHERLLERAKTDVDVGGYLPFVSKSRGLANIRQGDAARARDDLELAAALLERQGASKLASEIRQIIKQNLAPAAASASEP